MKEIQLSTGHYIAIPLPEGARDCFLSTYGKDNVPVLIYSIDILYRPDYVRQHSVYIPQGQWSIIGTTKEIQQDDMQCQNFFDDEVELFDQTVGFPNFLKEDDFFVHWGEDMGKAGIKSFASLRQLHQIGENDIWLKLQNNKTQPHRTGETAQ